MDEKSLSHTNCIRLDHLSVDEQRAYIIAHNALNLETGFDESVLLQELQEQGLGAEVIILSPPDRRKSRANANQHSSFAYCVSCTCKLHSYTHVLLAYLQACRLVLHDFSRSDSLSTSRGAEVIILCPLFRLTCILSSRIPHTGKDLPYLKSFVWSCNLSCD